MKKTILLTLFIFVSWSLIRIFLPIHNGVEEVILKPLLFLGPTLYLAYEENPKKWLKLLGIKKEFFVSSLVYGCGISVLLIVYAVGINYFLKGQAFNFNLSSLNPMTLLWHLFISFSTAFCEEIVFRGYIFQQLLTKKQPFWAALFFSTFAFVAIHIARAIFVLHLSGGSLFSYLYLLVFLSTVNTLVFWKTKNIAAPIATHTLWNFYSGF